MPTTVSLVAPVANYRGGIARHSSMLARALAEQEGTELVIEGFRRLYPQSLYPGKDPRLTDATPPDGLLLRENLDTLDPRTWRRVARDIATRGGIALFPAWTFFTAPCLGWIARYVQRRGVEVVTLVHNVTDHERKGWKTRLLKWQLLASDRIVTHSQELAAAVRHAGFTGPVAIEPHPPYSDFPEPAGTMPRQHALELLCFGLVRPYKGVDIALRALATAKLADVRLTVAGEIWPDAEEVREMAAAMPQVELLDGYIPDEQAAELFARADAILLPYRNVTGSGVLAMARHYRRAVIASDLPALAREIEQDGLGWVFPSENEEALASLLREQVSRSSATAIATTAPDPAQSQGWSRIANLVTG